MIGMLLNISQIKLITTGAARVTQEADGFHFYRFTEGQEAIYKVKSAEFYRKTFCTSGVQLRFRTDSTSLRLKGSLRLGTKRTY